MREWLIVTLGLIGAFLAFCLLVRLISWVGSKNETAGAALALFAFCAFFAWVLIGATDAINQILHMLSPR